MLNKVYVFYPAENRNRNYTVHVISREKKYKLKRSIEFFKKINKLSTHIMLFY